MQGCTTYIQPSQGCVHLAKDDHKVVCTLQMLMQGCHKLAATLQGCNKLAARLPQPRNFHMGTQACQIPCFTTLANCKIVSEANNTQIRN